MSDPFGSPFIGRSPHGGKTPRKPEGSPGDTEDYGEFGNDVFESGAARTTRASAAEANTDSTGVPHPRRPATGKSKTATLPAVSLRTPPPVTPGAAPKTTGKSVLTTRVVLYSDGDLLKKAMCWGYIGREKMSFCTKDRSVCSVCWPTM